MPMPRKKMHISPSLTPEDIKFIEDIQYLEKISVHANISKSCAILINAEMDKKKEAFVLKVNQEAIQPCKNKERRDGSYYIIYRTRKNGERRYTSCATYEGLIDLLYEHYTGLDKGKKTLQDIYGPATIWKRDKKTNPVTGKTLKEYSRIWLTRIKPYPISNQPLSKLTAKDLRKYIENIIDEKNLRYEEVQDIRNVLSYLFIYAIRCEIMEHNILKDIVFSDFEYSNVKKRNKNKIQKKPLPLSKIPEAIEYCDSVLLNPRREKKYPLVFKLALEIGDRFGEIFGVCKSNVNLNEGMILIDDQRIPTYTMDDDLQFHYHGRQNVGYIKGHNMPEAIPISPTAVDILKELMDLCPDSDMVLPTFRYNTFNNYIKEVAAHIGLNPKDYSTHSLRVSAGTQVYRDTHDILLVQKYLHHATPEMTSKYIQDIEDNDRLKNYFYQRENAKNKSRPTATPVMKVSHKKRILRKPLKQRKSEESPGRGDNQI